MPAGSYALTARSTDDDGDSTTSSAVNVTVTAPNTPPTAQLTSPADGASFTAPASIAMTATASDSDGNVTQVAFYADGNLLDTDTTAPYCFTWNDVPAGSYALTARSTDDDGDSTTSSAVNVTVTAPNTPPTAQLTSPAEGASFTAPASIAMTASASDSDGNVTQVAFYADGNLLHTDTTAPYSFTWNDVPAGSYALTARSTDDDGDSTTSSAVNVTVTAPNTPPTAQLTSPAEGASFTAPASIAMTATASDSDGNVTQVAFYADGNLLHTDTTAPYSFTWNDVPAGSYALTARSTDDDGDSTTSSAVNVTVTAPNTPPTAQLTSPAEGASFTAPASIAMTATASDSDGNVTQVAFYADGNLIGTDTTAPYSFTWNDVPAGSYALTARSTDDDGDSTTSSAVNVTVTAPNTPPTAQLTSPAEGASFTAPASIAMTATASDSDGNVTQVAFYADGNLLHTDTTAPYSFTWNDVPAGSYALTARSTDDDGDSTTSSAVNVTVTAPNTPPTAQLTSPTEGASFTAPASIAMTATASDSDGNVTQVAFYADGNLIGTDTTAPYSVHLERRARRQLRPHRAQHR